MISLSFSLSLSFAIPLASLFKHPVVPYAKSILYMYRTFYTELMSNAIILQCCTMIILCAMTMAQFAPFERGAELLDQEYDGSSDRHAGHNSELREHLVDVACKVWQWGIGWDGEGGWG